MVFVDLIAVIQSNANFVDLDVAIKMNEDADLDMTIIKMLILT